MNSDSPKRILHVIPDGGMGGAGRIVIDLVQHQARDPRFEPCVAVLTEGDLGGEVPTERLVRLNMKLSRKATPGRFRRLRRVVEKFSPALIHSHLWPAASCALSATVGMRGVRHLVHVHDTLPSLIGNDLRTRIRKGLLRLPLALGKPEFIAVSEACRHFAIDELGIGDDSIRTVLNGIDTSKFRSMSPLPTSGPFVLGTAGRFAVEKGHHYLFEAVRQLVGGGHDVRLLLAGDGGLRSDYDRLVAEMSIEDHVEFRGKVSDMDAFYRELNAFVLPSISSEGLPLVLLEAMGSGAPVIATRCAGAPEAVNDEFSGLLVNPKDGAAIAAAVERLIDAPSLAQTLRDNARRDVEQRFDKGRMCEQITEICAEMLSLPELSRPASQPSSAKPSLVHR